MPIEWPHTAIGIASLIAVVLGIVGATGWGVVRKWFYGPLERRINEETKERRRADDELTKDCKREFDRIDNPETGRITLHRSSLKHDIDEVGSIVNEIKEDIAGRETRTRLLEDRMNASEQDRGVIHREQGQTVARVKAVEEKVSEIAVNIIGAVQSAKEETMRAISEQGKEIRRISEQVAVIGDRQDRDRDERERRDGR